MFTSQLSAQDNKDVTINTLRNELKSLIRINQELREEINRLKSVMIDREESMKSPSKPLSSSEEYRIQLGIQNSAIASLASPKMIAGSIVNGKMVYDIGGFQNPNDAFSLSQELRKLNLAGSFVTRYINGVRDFNYKFDSNVSYQPQPSFNETAAKARPAASYNSESGDLNLNTTSAKKSKIMVIED